MESIQALVLALPEVAAWPELVSLIEREESKPPLYWDLPVLACQAVGGNEPMAAPGVAAIACMQISIILVDDMLDEDPRGEYLRSGSGPTANLALAFQATAFRVIEPAAIDAQRRAALAASLAWLAHATALGQHRDTQNLSGEENYWQVVRAKSSPFFGAALYVGALLGNAGHKVAVSLRDLGTLIGEIIQISDDLSDAFQTPANPDWTQGRPSLPILYARTADHPQRARFMDLLPRSHDPQALREAQHILVECGAVSYCVYHLVKRHQAARQLLESIPLADPAPLRGLLARLAQLTAKLLQSSGPTGALRRMCQCDSPTVNLDARQKHSGMTSVSYATICSWRGFWPQPILWTQMNADFLFYRYYSGVIPARFRRESSGPTGALHRMCQCDSPTVNLDARQKHSGMTAE